MSLTDYAGLSASISDWLMRSDLDNVIPDFIQLAEEDIQNNVRVRQMLVRAITVPAADEPYENLPGDYLELKAIQFNSNPLYVPQYRTPAWLRAYRRGTASASGTPRFYTIEGNQLLFEHTPADVELEILYYQKIPSLDAITTTTNWLLDEFPSVYLWGALTQSAPYIREDARISTWDTLFARSKQALVSQDQRAEINAPPIAITSRRRAIG